MIRSMQTHNRHNKLLIMNWSWIDSLLISDQQDCDSFEIKDERDD